MSDEEKEVRQKRKDLVKKRFKEIKERRYKSTPRIKGYYNEKIEEEQQEARDNMFKKWMDKKNRNIRKYYESENEDAIKNSFQESSDKEDSKNKKHEFNFMKKIKQNRAKNTYHSSTDDNIYTNSDTDNDSLKSTKKSRNASKTFTTIPNPKNGVNKTPLSSKNFDLNKVKTNEKNQTKQDTNTRIQTTKKRNETNKKRGKDKSKEQTQDKKHIISADPLLNDPSFYANQYEYDTSFTPIYTNDLDQTKNTEIPPYVTENIIRLRNGYNQEFDNVYDNTKFKIPSYNICDVDPFKKIHQKTKEVYNKRRNGLAYVQNQRNFNELDSICKRQNMFLND